LESQTKFSFSQWNPVPRPSSPLLGSSSDTESDSPSENIIPHIDSDEDLNTYESIPKTKNEKTLIELPHEDLSYIKIDETLEIKCLGNVTKKINQIKYGEMFLIVEPLPNSEVIDLDTLLFTNERKIIGKVF